METCARENGINNLLKNNQLIKINTMLPFLFIAKVETYSVRLVLYNTSSNVTYTTYGQISNFSKISHFLSFSN